MNDKDFRVLCARARSSAGEPILVCGWTCTAVQVAHRGRTGPAWTWCYTLTHSTFRPYCGGFPTVGHLASWVNRLRRHVVL